MTTPTSSPTTASAVRAGPPPAATDHSRAAALDLATTGRCYDLATQLSAAIPHGPADTFGGFRLTPYRIPQALIDPDNPPPFDFSMEVIAGSLHVGTHIDGLAHIHSRGRMFGDIASRESYTDFGWRDNGAETIAPIITRGLLLDLPAHLGLPVLPDGYQVSVHDVEGCLQAQHTPLTAGDAVLVRTGKIADFHAGSDSYFSAQPGVGVAAATWLYEHGMTLLGTDTSGTEPHPIRDRSDTTHQAMLVERGVHLLEILDLEELAADRVHEFCLVCLPLKIVGATGSWVRPVALT